MSRNSGEIKRVTKETDILLQLELDGSGTRDINTGIGFLDHMLQLFAYHGMFDLSVKCTGDTDVDGHHTTEDVGICLGQAISIALGDKIGIKRYAFFILPMDEALATCALDISGRQYLRFDAVMKSDMVGGLDTQMVREFFRALAFNAGLTLHIDCKYGENDHHVIEAMFKCFARALKEAVIIEKGINEAPSSKGFMA